jgi:NarL family two-component system sensor histidine kinase LiaS
LKQFNPDVLFIALFIGIMGVIFGRLPAATFRQLRWRLTQRYAIVTVTAFLVVGLALATVISSTTELDLANWSLLLGYSVLTITLFSGTAGTIFGFMTARRLAGRLGLLSKVTTSWSRGDFSVFIDDSSEDELGQLARRLNHMAEQLQDLLDERQAMSVLEERNRLARDLHDSVKQQAFAASAQLGAARALLQRDAQAAEVHLSEADRLIDNVRQELVTLIHELRPAGLQGKGLAAALHEYAEEWARQSDIDMDVRVQGERTLPLEVERALFRIVQEALANVTRHSQACSAEVLLVYGADSIVLTITDDGQGFGLGSRRGGLGLHSMRERAESLKGTLGIESAPGRGTRVSATIPLALGDQSDQPHHCLNR